VTVAITSPTAEVRFLGDPGNEQGFKTSGGVLVPAGPVVWTSYTTNDTTAPSGTAPLNLSGRDFMTFENIIFQGTTGGVVIATGATTTDLTFRKCVFQAVTTGTDSFNYTSTAGVAANLLFENCIFNINSGSAFRITGNRHTADYDLNIVIRNSIFHGPGYGILCLDTGSGTGFPGGVVVYNSTLYGAGNGVTFFTSANWSTTITNKIYNSYIVNAVTALSATTAGSIVEDYNVIHANSARTNVTAGGNSQTTARAPALDWGYSLLHGFQPRSAYVPRDGSPLLGFGATGAVTSPTTDIVGRPRPAGGASTSNAVGAFERHDTAIKETTTTDAGSIGLVITGPGDHDFIVPVNATSTTFTIRARYDTTHTATTKPQVILQANAEIGVSASTVTMTAAADTWETLTVGPFTPTAQGFVTLRLVSRPTAGAGKAFFDTAVVPNINTGDFAHYRRGEPFPALEGASGSGGPVGSGRLTGGLQ